MTTPGAAWADEPAFPADAVEVGRILGPWGLKGMLRVQAFSSDPKALFSSRRWFLKPPDGAVPRPPGLPPVPPLLRITHSKEHGDGVVASAQEVPDRTAAEALKGARIFVGRASFPTAAEGEYYWVDLLGLDVVNREGEPMGQVIELLDTGAHSVLRLRRPDAVEGAKGEAAERLIPFVAAFIDDVNLDQRRITVDWGLDY